VRTLTLASPAIDAGENIACAAAPVNGVDQRGQVRPNGSACDIGAYEYVHKGPWYVDAGPLGSDFNSCLTASSPCKTISGGIGKAANNETVIVAAGSYTEFVALDRHLTVVGAGAGSTLLIGGVSGSPALHVGSNGQAEVILSGFTVEKGSLG